MIEDLDNFNFKNLFSGDKELENRDMLGIEKEEKLSRDHINAGHRATALLAACNLYGGLDMTDEVFCKKELAKIFEIADALLKYLNKN